MFGGCFCVGFFFLGGGWWRVSLFQTPFYSSIFREIPIQYSSVRLIFTCLSSLFLDDDQRFGLSVDPNYPLWLTKSQYSTLYWEFTNLITL